MKLNLCVCVHVIFFFSILSFHVVYRHIKQQKTAECFSSPVSEAINQIHSPIKNFYRDEEKKTHTHSSAVDKASDVIPAPANKTK